MVRTQLNFRGFSLVETLVAIAVLITAVTGVLTVAGKGLRLTGVAREQLIASYLAQEPIEFIRNVRDSNRLQSSLTPWLEDLDDCLNQDCIIDPTFNGNPTVATQPCTGTCSVLNFNSASGLYRYDTGAGWVPSKYTRTTRVITPIDGQSNEARIDVTVSWPAGTATRTFRIQEYILNW